ncbi:DUF4244 domain-containing protein [Microbispora sp. NPDC049633]|uniref:DUF4244 domain-containing protein n=1 Tax=Microbispora sp. NPDC049633 TaxID=3154355 RepID=UPI003415B15A
MSKHAATGRRKQTGTQAGTQAGTVFRRRAGDAGGRHRVSPARWAALGRAVRRALSSRSGRASVLALSCVWAKAGGGVQEVRRALGRLSAAQAVRGAARVVRGAVRRASAVPAVRHALGRLFAALRRSAAGVSCRARELSIQWTVQAGTRAEAGMSTAEYAVGTIAACGFAALLWKVVTSAEVRSMLAALIQKALKLAA